MVSKREEINPALQRKEHIKEHQINIRIEERLREWLNKRSYSPTLIFRAACHDLGYENKIEQKTKEKRQR